MNNSKFNVVYRAYGTYIILVGLIILLSIFTQGFVSVTNLTNVLRTASVYAILGCGMTFVMISGKIDLSVGSVVALSGCVAAIMMGNGMSMILSTIIGLFVGVVCGLINGFCIAKLRVPFFIMTAGMMYAASGLALVITHETSFSIRTANQVIPFDIWGARTLLHVIPSQAIIACIFFLILLYILKETRFGRYTYAIGSNQRTAHLSGVNVDRYTIMIFALNGLAAALAGIVVASRLKIGSPISGDGYEIDAIAVAAIGGTSMTGGEGRLAKTIAGAFILAIIRSGLNIAGVSSSNQKIVIGAVLVVVVALDMLDKKREG